MSHEVDTARISIYIAICTNSREVCKHSPPQSCCYDYYIFILAKSVVRRVEFHTCIETMNQAETSPKLGGQLPGDEE